jgi:hypothetical protein
MAIRNSSRSGGNRPRTHPKSKPNPLRNELLSICDRLALVQASATTAELALRNQKVDQDTEVSMVLRLYVVNELDRQIERLTALAARCGKGAS